jgi:hypothetical protein
MLCTHQQTFEKEEEEESTYLLHGRTKITVNLLFKILPYAVYAPTDI